MHPTNSTRTARIAPRLAAFLASERGAVTVDWVVLIGAALALTLGMLNTIGGSVENVANESQVKLITYEISTAF